MRLITRFAVLLLLLAGNSLPVKAQSTQPPKPAAKDALYIPKDLDDALKELRRTLLPKTIADMKRRPESDMVLYHMGLGTGLRNSWGLWTGSRLSKWFNSRGIRHPDDMSGIILTSFWRSLHQKPLLVEVQIKHYQSYWQKAKQDQEKEARRVVRAKAEIRQRMLGLRREPPSPEVITVLPNRTTAGLSTRYAAPFFDGCILLTAKEILRRQGEDFITPAYLLDMDTEQLRLVQIPEIERIENAIVVDGGSTAYFHGTSAVGANKGRTDILLEIGRNGRRRQLPVPPGTGSIRLGIGAGTDLLLIRSKSVHRWDAVQSRWEKLYSSSGSVTLPRSGPPPRLLGKRLYFRDEGRIPNGYERLSWIDMVPSSSTPSLHYFDDHVGFVGQGGPNWYTVWSYGYAAVGAGSAEGALWIATGIAPGQQSLLRWTAKDGYRIALFNDETQYGEIFYGGNSWSASDTVVLAVTGIEVHKDGSLSAVGPQGLHEIKDGQIRTIARFGDASQSIPNGTKRDYGWQWVPSLLLTVRSGLYLISGEYGGVYLLKQAADIREGFSFVSVDEHLGPPIRL